MERNYCIDFDGVILDSQDRFEIDMKDNVDFNDWIEYLSSIDWYNFIRECTEIDESLSVLRKLQKLQKISAIITSIHSMEEGNQKMIFLRENNITVPIIYVLPTQKKSDIYIPKFKDTLIDDKKKNCDDWISRGGSAILFDSHSKSNEKNKIKTLKQLL